MKGGKYLLKFYRAIFIECKYLDNQLMTNDYPYWKTQTD